MATPSRSRRDFATLESRRFQAARLFAKGESQGAVARALGVTPVTAHHWYHAWHANGRAGLKAAGRAGRKPKLEPKQLATIEQALRAGPRVYGFKIGRASCRERGWIEVGAGAWTQKGKVWIQP